MARRKRVMYCKFCGKEIEEGDSFCPYCGKKQHGTNSEKTNETAQGNPSAGNYGGCQGGNAQNGYYQGGFNQNGYNQSGYYQNGCGNGYYGGPYGQQPVRPRDDGNAGWAVLGFFIPIAGLILYLVWKDEYPKRARMCGKGALIFVIVYAALIVFCLLIIIIGVSVSASAGSLPPLTIY